MKKLLISLFLIVFTFSAQAFDGWKCKLAYKKDRPHVAALKLPNYRTGGRLNVDSELCTYNEYSGMEVCRIKGHNLVIGLDSKLSMLITKAGKTYGFKCEYYGNEEQEEQEEEDPGHGGSTYGGGNHQS